MIEFAYAIRNEEGEWEERKGLLLENPRELKNKSKSYAKDMFVFWFIEPDGKLCYYRYPDMIKDIHWTGREVCSVKAHNLIEWRKELCPLEK